jgi:hypothetical protein
VQRTVLVLRVLLYAEYYFNWFPFFLGGKQTSTEDVAAVYWLDTAKSDVSVALGAEVLPPSAINRRAETREIARE